LKDPTLADANLQWGGDLAVSPTGDIALCDSPLLGTQRVLRRLLTNPVSYIWHTDYGAGLGMFVGSPANQASIAAVIRTQLKLETAVAASSPCSVSVSSQAGGIIVANIAYVDSSTASPQFLSFSLGA
jgi:hypothetical protein